MPALQRFFEVILDAIVPLRERSARTKVRRAEDIPLTPQVHSLLGIEITTLMDYREAAVQDLVRAIKYDGSPHGARLAATLLADYLREEIASHKGFSQREVLLVPIPLHRSRARERGFNQIEVVLRALPPEFRDGTLARYAPDLLERTRKTKPQTKLPRSERLSNVAGAFDLAGQAAHDKQMVQGKKVFVIDDVTTTGATLANASTPLRRAGAEVSLIALARA